jgi:bifunctional non-homologous end joining protein LigD
MGLEEYKRKRRFGRTPEPKGHVGPSRSRHLYVVQKHAASRLHYDVRLELGGTLKSWAVPKGPSLDPAQKRLAVHVEDHPVEYGAFEGVIPEGEYGGGTVMLWDRGTWRPEGEGDAEEAYRRGRLKFQLAGKRLQGGWMLVRMKRREEREEREEADNWLLMKEADAKAVRSPKDDAVPRFLDSVATGRSMEEIARQRKKVWTSSREAPFEARPRSAAVSRPTRRTRGGATSPPVPDPSSLPGARKADFPATFKPQLATLVTEVPQGEEWLHEIKFDGYRLLCFLEHGQVRLVTRRGQNWTAKFPSLARAAARLPIIDAVLDGEVIVQRGDGTSDFQALQNLLQGERSGRLLYYLFDLPYCEGYDLTRTPLLARRRLLNQVLERAGHDRSPLRYSEHIQGKGPQAFLQACRMAVEGLISKHAESPYLHRRSSHWLKVRCIKRQEFVIGGFTEPGGSRHGFGALLLGYHDRDGHLRYAGRVGTGFTEARLRELLPQLRALETGKRPFVRVPRGESLRGIHWIRPKLVAEVEFTEWTSEGILRHPSFQGLREDKAPHEVTHEQPSPLEDVPDAKPAAGRTRPTSFGLSHPERILYPDDGISKEDLAEYYHAVAEWMLPHVIDRPLTVVRCPEGHGQDCFFQKRVMEGMPGAIRGVRVKERHGSMMTMVIHDWDGLLGLVQMGVLEIHPWGTRVQHLDNPDRMIFDLDPAPGVAWRDVLEGARLIRKILEEVGLTAFLKTTGGKGLHVVVPLEPLAGWDDVKAFAKAISSGLAKHLPERYIDVMTKSKRGGKIFIDYLRNGYGATSVAAYSTRAKPGAPVSMPLRWNEVTPDLDPGTFTLETVPKRLHRLRHDPWAELAKIRQTISPDMQRQVERLIK